MSPEFHDRIDAHCVDVYELVSQLTSRNPDDDNSEAETITAVVSAALERYDKRTALLVASALYVNVLLDAFENREIA